MEEQILESEENEKEDSLLNIVNKKKIHKRNSSKPQLKAYKTKKKIKINKKNLRKKYTKKLLTL